MKLYSVKAEWTYGEEKDKTRQAQLDMVDRMGLKESRLGVVICEAEEALELLIQGYCGSYASVADSITNVYTKPDDIKDLISAAVSSSVESVGKLFNEKTQSEQPSPNLMSVNETKLLEDCCTDALQEHLAKGWRILAICPQPKRRPDYVMGRSSTP